MSYVIFENPGEIDPIVIRTFGVSVKESENPIGFFGTGLKYALAILLRTQHEISIQAGTHTHIFGTDERIVRGATFKLITMDGEPLGFTQDVGKNWEVWMAYRELYCNCKDEGGKIYTADELPEPSADVTRVIVRGEEFLTQHLNRDVFILESNPILKLDGVDVHRDESRGLFYRGMLVHRFPKAQRSKYTYNFTRAIDLTEDRTAKYASFLPMYLASSILGAENEEFLRELLVAPNDYFEHDLNFRDDGTWGIVKASDKFLSITEDLARDRAARTNISALTRFKAAKRQQLTPGTTQLRGVEAEILERAVKFCKTLGFDIDEYPMIVTDSLGHSVLGMAEGQRIYISRLAFMQGTKRVAGTLTEEYIHLKYGYADESREFQDFLVDRLMSLGEQMRGEPL